MQSFPDSFKFLEFFCSEPELSDPDVPWEYNRLTFRRTINDETISCIIEPGYQTLILNWIRGDQELVLLSLKQVSSIVFNSEDGHPIMLAEFASDASLQSLKLRLDPTPRIEWGNCSDA